MPNFYNAKTDFGAVGDGVHDDTAAIQAAMNAAFPPGSKGLPLYVPTGTYKITAGLLISAGVNVYMFGDGLDQTKFVWGGPAPNGSALVSLLRTNGCIYSQFVGMSFDISGPNTCCLNIDYTSGPINVNGDTFIDIATVNAESGVLLGLSGIMGSEMVFFKCKFTDHKRSGISTCNQNALNAQTYGCDFTRCASGGGAVGYQTNAAACLCQGGSFVAIVKTTFTDSGSFDIHTSGDSGCIIIDVMTNNSLGNNGYYGGPTFMLMEHATYMKGLKQTNPNNPNGIVLWRDSLGSLFEDCQFGHGDWSTLGPPLTGHVGPVWIRRVTFADPGKPTINSTTNVTVLHS